jgi:hypothetical protein
MHGVELLASLGVLNPDWIERQDGSPAQPRLSACGLVFEAAGYYYCNNKSHKNSVAPWNYMELQTFDHQGGRLARQRPGGASRLPNGQPLGSVEKGTAR